MFPFRLYAATGDAVAQIDSLDGERADVTLNLEGRGVQCVAVDPHDPQRIFVGTFDRGVYRTLDGGGIWETVGAGMADARVLSIAVSPVDRVNGRSAVYIGPSQTARSSRRGRPGFWRGLPRLRIGSGSAHDSSSTRQIAGSSRSVGAVAAADCGVSMPPAYHRQPRSG